MSDPQPAARRVALIGTGAIAHAHAQAVIDLAPRVEIVAVVDVDAARARAFADRFAPGAAVYPDAGALLRGEHLDLVHICTPPQTHVPLAIQALRAGVPALIEKPTALSLAEMDELVAVSRETGVPALTVFQHRFGPAAVRLRRLLAGGVLGRPLVATCETLWYRTADYFDLPWRGRWEIEGGGPTMGHGIHQFDLLLSVLGPWTRLSAFAARQALPTDTEDVSMALVEFDNGALATVVNSLVSPRETSRLRFDFAHATVEVEHLYGYTDADWTFTPAPGHEHLAELWAEDASDETSGHRGQIAAILDAWDAGQVPAAAADDARRTLEFAAATYASAFRGRPVAAGEIAGDDPFLRSMDGGAVPWGPAPSRQEAHA
ncbi:Gfo/Idh/MocA family oxidoreductase [Microbacterium sp. W1N]|uniref:Gfo/Idh/MocA family protein n=1 Tax=Microbacterium festucae TaxID=2977531 RepID=UPI0021C04BB7|nr:Gfo/Idh/MocA family oxidoreductase [Microbacterium festucae]MCT9819799.1 Gfo/Idh/MocA family oxidoreductase [Microbacterium festucae]